MGGEKNTINQDSIFAKPNLLEQFQQPKPLENNLSDANIFADSSRDKL